MLTAPRAIWLGWALVCAMAALPLPVPVSLRAVLAGLALGVVPGALAANRIAPEATGATRALLALTLSPFLAAAPAALLILSGVPVAAAARAVAGIAALLALFDAKARGRATAPAESDRTAWVAATLFAGFILAFHAANPFLAPRSDGWFHGAVTLQIAARGLPVEDPAFAGLPLLYYWGPALWCAMWLALDPRLSVWTPWIALDLAAAFATLIGVVALARRLGAPARAQALAAAFAVFGYAPFAWLMVAARAATGEVRGAPEVLRLLTLGADQALRSLDPGFLHISLLFFGDKFLVLTPFALGLALFAAFVLAFLDAIGRPGPRSAAALALIAAAALFTHTLVGLTCVLLGGMWWIWGLARAARGEQVARRALLPLGLALGAAVLLLAPYLLAIHSGQRHVSFGLSAQSVATLVLAGALFVPAGFAWLARGARERGPARELLPLALVLAALGLALGLPGNNHCKFWNLLFLLLAPPAALAWSSGLDRMRGAPRAALVTGLLVAVVPTVAACMVGFASERGQNEERAHFATPGARAAWEWARARTPPDAVMVDAEGASDMLVLAGRSVLWGGGVIERDWGYPAPALDVRRRASRELGSGAALSRDARALLASLRREVIVVERAAYGDSVNVGFGALARAGEASPYAPDVPARGRGPARGGGERVTPLFRNADLAFYRWEGGR